MRNHQTTQEPSGRLYSTFTKHWPRIATGLVVVLGIVELVAGGLTADSGVEFYLMAWAATTGAVWFLFEKAEKALSDEARKEVVEWISQRDLTGSIRSLPAQFALLFDRVFGEKHWSLKCARRAAIASACMFVLSAVMNLPWFLDPAWWDPIGREPGLPAANAIDVAWVVVVGVSLNLVPDFISLLETRWLVGLASRVRRLSYLLLIVLADLLLTGLIFFLFYLFVLEPFAGGVLHRWVREPLFMLGLTREDDLFWLIMPPGSPERAPFGGNKIWVAGLAVMIQTTFMTSLWLWLYTASVPVSRVLLRMNSGLGFLLRITDIERQPFRSVGFVAVIVTSVLFAFGLPWVFL